MMTLLFFLANAAATAVGDAADAIRVTNRSPPTFPRPVALRESTRGEGQLRSPVRRCGFAFSYWTVSMGFSVMFTLSEVASSSATDVCRAIFATAAAAAAASFAAIEDLLLSARASFRDAAEVRLWAEFKA